MSPSFSDFIGFFSLFVALGAVGFALWMFDEQRKEARIDNFVTRYIAMVREDDNPKRDVHGLVTMLDAGILWLKSNDEIREAVCRLTACRIRQPFNTEDLESDLLNFFKTANEIRADLNSMWGIIMARVKAKESAMPPI